MATGDRVGACLLTLLSLGFCMLPLGGAAQVLYDGAGGLPAAQGWSYAALGGSQTMTNDAVLLDTSPSRSFQAGYALPASTLNRTNGFTLLFSSRVLTESHANNNRAGFSIIVLADDKRGIELAFWTNTIFAQSDSPLFTHAEETNFPTTSLVHYALTFQPATYTLSADGAPILWGPVRDYTAFRGFFNPYSSANFLFFGDDTTSAGGAFLLKNVTLVPSPRLVALAEGRIVWTGVPNLAYTVQSSSNLTGWAVEGSATSASFMFMYTSRSNGSPRFFRVVYP